MAMLTFLVDSLGRLQEVMPVLRSLGPRFTPEVRSAWMAALETLAGTMTQAARMQA
jgi:hypothetical protein